MVKRIKFNKSIKKRLSLWGGIAGLTVGAWLIFISGDNNGFFFAAFGALLLIRSR